MEVFQLLFSYHILAFLISSLTVEVVGESKQRIQKAQLSETIEQALSERAQQEVFALPESSSTIFMRTCFLFATKNCKKKSNLKTS